MMSAFSPFRRSPFEYMMMPHATEQYGHVLRVSVVLTSLNGRMAWAKATSASPKPSAPTVVTARLALALTKRWRRESSMFIDFLLQNACPLRGTFTSENALATQLDRRALSIF